MKKKTDTFERLLAEALEPNSSDSLEAPVERFENVVPLDFKKKLQSIEKIPVSQLTEDQKDILKLRNLMGELRMRSKLSEGGLSHYKKGIPSALEKAKQLASKLAKIATSPAGKKIVTVGGKVLGPLAVAGDVLASEELGSDEESELQKIKQQKIAEDQIRKALNGDVEKLEELKRKAKEISQSAISPEEMLTVPVAKSEDLGQQESPDLEEMDKILNYSDYLKKRKKIMGYE